MFKDLPVDVGVVYEGERIRSKEMFVEFAGPKSFGAELAQTRRMDEIQDGKITIIGPEITEMKEGGRYPFAILVEVAGEKVEKDLEGILERRIHEFINYVQGVMHLNQRDAIWLRVNKESRKKGLTLNHIGKAITRLFKAEYPFIEKVQVTFITDESKVKEFVKKAREIYGERDARVRGIKEEEVDKFYGCVLCQSFSPSHVCVITPERISLCGAISWLDGRAAARINPEGANFEVEKGNLLDPIRGEYEGVNKVVEKRSGGSVKRFFLHSIFSFPHTSCCTEDTKVILENGDVIRIKDALRNPIRLLSLNGGKITPQTCIRSFKLKAPKRLIKIRFRSGNELTLTPEHKLPIDRAPRLQWVEAKDIQVGDYALALKKLIIKPRVPYIVDLLPKDIGIIVSMGRIKRKLISKYGSLLKASKFLSIKLHRFYNQSISIKELEKILEDEDILKASQEFMIGPSRVKISTAKMNDELSYILGLVASDGSIVCRGKYEKDVSIVNTDLHLLNHAKDTLIKLFPNVKVKIEEKENYGSVIDGKAIRSTKVCYQLKTNNPILGLIGESLGIKSTRNNWALHKLIKLPESMISNFLSGYFDGDGMFRVNKNSGYEVGELSLSIDNNEAALDLQLLLKRLEIVSSVRFDEDVYKIEVHGNDLKRLIKTIKPWHKDRKARIEKYVPKFHGVSRSLILPYMANKLISELGFKGLASSAASYIRNYKVGPTVETAMKVLARNGGSKISCELKALIDTDYYLEKVEEIKIVSGHGKNVYDLTIFPSHNYVANQIIIKNCGCFEAIAFYIPEVDGIGVVTRDFDGLTPFGIPFSTMAGQAGGGVQISGFTGIGTEYFRSKKFFQADGGYNRLVWLPKIFKERIKDAIPPTLYDKIATEETAPDLKVLKEFLQKVNHPVTERWKEKVPAAVPPMAEVVEAKNEAKAAERPEVVAPVALPTAMVPAAGGIKIILKNAKIYAEKVIIVRREEKK